MSECLLVGDSVEFNVPQVKVSEGLVAGDCAGLHSMEPEWAMLGSSST